jgi:hypothetical protein
LVILIRVKEARKKLAIKSQLYACQKSAIIQYIIK